MTLTSVPSDHLRLVHGKYRRVCIAVEIRGDIRLLGITEDTFELLLGGPAHRGIDLVLARCALGDELEVDDRDIRRGHADRDAVELAVKLGDDQSPPLWLRRSWWGSC